MIEKKLEGTFGYEEMMSALLPDERYRNNLMKMCNSLLEKPGHSFSAACGSVVRKSASRLFDNENQIDLQEGHLEKTISRCKKHSLVLVLEDSTDLNYHTHRKKKGMGDLGGEFNAKGICMHSALAVTPKGEPLGIIGQYIWSPVKTGRPKQNRTYPIEEKESYKWLRTKKWVNAALETQVGQVIVIGDREADFYHHLSFERASNVDLLIRISQLKRIVIHQEERKPLREVEKQETPIGEISVEIKRQKNRKSRIAKLAIKVTKVVCPPTRQKNARKTLIPMTLIHAKEILYNGEVKDPIEWYLYTSCEVENLEQASQMIRFYSLRWIIERFHYVLKSGLRVEKMQFDNFTRIANALKLYSVIGWKLLWMNHVGKAHPNEDAVQYFDAIEIKVLELFTVKKIQTVKQFILALGSLSGFSPSTQQPLPGEKLLWQSMKLLIAMKKGFLLSNNNDPEFYGTG